jgi:hypothetical protein
MEQQAAPGTQVNEVTLNEQGQPVFYNEDMSGAAATDFGIVGGQQVATPGEAAFRPGVTDLAYGLMAQGVDVPQQQLAGFTPAQQAAFAAAQGGVGAYLPYLQQAGELTDQAAGIMSGAVGGTQDLAGQIPGALQPGMESVSQAQQDIAAAVQQGQAGAGFGMDTVQGGLGTVQGGLSTINQGISGLSGTGGMFSPDQISPFMSEYEDAAVQQAMKDIARQGELREQELKGQAVQAGAFGGSRQAVAEQELARNVLGEQGRTAAQMRAAGFESAAARAQQAYEDSLLRQQQAASTTGQLGVSQGQLGLGAGQLGLGAGEMGLAAGQLGMQGAQAAGDLGLNASQLGLAGIQAGLGAQQQAAGIGQGIAGIGQQALGMGQTGQQMNLQDVNTLLGIGGQQQQQAQAGLDVAYANQYANAMMPYQQLAFASDIIQGAPSGQMSTMTQPGPSIGSQVAGIGMGAYGISQLLQ